VLRGALLVFLTVAGLALPGSAGACGCGEVTGPLVAQGRSPHHVPWYIRAEDDTSNGFAFFDFGLRKPGYPAAGYTTGLPLPIPDQFVFTADTGSGLDPFHESDLSGIAAGRVSTLIVSVGRGHRPLRISPRPAPAELLTTMPWLGSLRFFDRFFSDKLTPRVVTALDANGAPLARVRSNRGLF
jgi:hypothetical protein